jgi:aryl-alcohol dehydrogenase-like predicted oxidoreductase
MTTPLTRRPLGRTGLDISTVGAGTWAIGGSEWKFNWGPQDDASSVRALRRAIELGVNWIDTAAAYGRGHAEEIVGRVLAGLPAADRPHIFTKCGLRWSNSDRFGDLQRNLRPHSIRMECEASLRRLRTERIDLYQFHWSDLTGTLVEDSWGELASLVDEGKVRAPAVSNFDVDLLERCEKIRHIESLQPPFSLIYRQAAANVIPWCAENGTGVIAYSPMQSGLLTDSFSAERIELMAPGDWRRWHPDLAHEFTPPRLPRNLALRDSLRPVAERHGTTVAAIANAWVLSWPGVTGAIVGSRSPDQVDGWIDAGAVTLTSADLDEIQQAADSLQAGSGPARPPTESATSSLPASQG